MSVRYRHDPNHPARSDTTRQLRRDNRLYCVVFPTHDLFKVGLSSGKNARGTKAVDAITRYLRYEQARPDNPLEWRAELPGLDDHEWGECQRLEMVFATLLKQSLQAEAAGAVGFEWFTRPDLDSVEDWRSELTSTLKEALAFSRLTTAFEWKEWVRPQGEPGAPQRNAHRTMRNREGRCARRRCGAALTDDAVQRGPFFYCCEDHATADLGAPSG